MSVLAAIGEGMIELELDAARDTARVAPGGDASNIAVMAARLGAQTRIGGRVGFDSFGLRLLDFWRASGVDVDQVTVDQCRPTGLYLNGPAPGGGHGFTYWRSDSAGSRLAPDDLRDPFFADVDMVVVTGVTLAVSRSSAAAAAHAIRHAERHGAQVTCVLNHRAQLGGDVATLVATARQANIVIGSVEDAAAIFGEPDPLRLAQGALPVPELVLTNGLAPATVVMEGTATEQPVPEVPVVNAAGAGDAFAGAYLATRLRGCSPATALIWGVAASARSVTRRGCAASYPTRSEAGELAEELAAV